MKDRDIRSLTQDDLYAWANHRKDVEGVHASAINRNDLVAASSVFAWAVGLHGGKLLPSNPVTGVSLEEPKQVAKRERTFRDAEVTAILTAASAVQPDERNPTFAAARRWCPWLAAYSGARIAELAHLEKRDIRTEAGIVVMDLRITKTGEPRTMPLQVPIGDKDQRWVRLQSALTSTLPNDPNPGDIATPDGRIMWRDLELHAFGYFTVSYEQAQIARRYG